MGEKEEKKKEQEEKKNKEEAADKDDAEKKDEDGEKAEEEEEDLSNWKPRFPTLWENYGKSLRLGLIEDSSNRARLTKLLRYKTSKSDGKFISLQEYVDRMPESQSGIFFLIGESMDAIKASPLLERAIKEEVEVLYMDDAIDEYVVQHMTEFSGKKMQNLGKADVKLFTETDRQKKIAQARDKAWEPFTTWLKEALGSQIDKAVVSDRVTDAPCVVVSPQYGMSAMMEKIMKAQALSDGSQGKQTARRILEINPRHPIVDELRRRHQEEGDSELCKDSAQLLLDIGSLQSGFSLEDPNAFATRIQRMVRTGLNLDNDAGLLEEEEYEIEEEEEDEEDDEEEDGEEADSEGEEEDVPRKIRMSCSL